MDLILNSFFGSFRDIDLLPLLPLRHQTGFRSKFPPIGHANRPFLLRIQSHHRPIPIPTRSNSSNERRKSLHASQTTSLLPIKNYVARMYSRNFAQNIRFQFSVWFWRENNLQKLKSIGYISNRGLFLNRFVQDFHNSVQI